LSIPNRKMAPIKNPTEAGITSHPPDIPDSLARSIAGINRPKQLAATITPPVKPSSASKIERRMVLKKKTVDAPAAVKNHVKQVA